MPTNNQLIGLAAAAGIGGYLYYRSQQNKNVMQRAGDQYDKSYYESKQKYGGDTSLGTELKKDLASTKREMQKP